MQEIFKEKLERLNEDELLIAAIKMIFNERINKELPEIERDDNTVIGEKYRAYSQAKKIIDAVFIDISDYKKVKNNVVNFNKGK